MSKNRPMGGVSAFAVVTFSLLATAACGTVSASIMPVKSNAASRVQVSEAYGKIPLHFEANQGQTGEQVRFLARGRGYTLFLAPSETVLVLTRREQAAEGGLRQARLRPAADGPVTHTALRMTLVGANPEPRLAGMEELPGKANYFIGNDPAKWRTNVPTYAKVRYVNVYPGIDLIYYGNQRQLEYDFVVRPGADPTTIALDYQGVDTLEMDARGDLVLHTAAGTIRQRKPVIYQQIDGERREISGGYVLKGVGRVGFQVTAYNQSRQLVIDPALFYSTYLGGNAYDQSSGIAVDASGNAYVTGTTASTDFPTTPGAFQTAFGSAFVTKLDPTGSAFVYSTYLGGSGAVGSGIAVDLQGNAYVTGTSSFNFPTTPGAFSTNGSAFVTKLDPTGSALVYSTRLGGSGSDYALGIAVDASGNAYLTGITQSTDFPTTGGSLQPTFRGGPADCAGRTWDGFVTKLDPTGSALVYSTYLGGSDADNGTAIAVDALGNAYVTGETHSSDFPTTAGAVQTTYGGSPNNLPGDCVNGGDAFVAKLDPTGSALVYSTYLGGSGDEEGFGIAVDALGNAYVTGHSQSTNYPTTTGAFLTAYAGGVSDAFVTKLNPTGSALVYSTYLGGGDIDVAYGIAVDASGNAYVTGVTWSSNFPTTAPAFQPTFGGAHDAFVAKLDPTGSALVYSTYLGGSVDDTGTGIAIDALPSPNAYVTGFTASTDFPTTAGAVQPALSGVFDLFVAQITAAVVTPGPFTARVTGGGTINVGGGMGSFHFIVQQQTDGTLSGQLQYINHATGARVQSVTYTSLLIVANTATFDGTCTVSGVPCTFHVHVTDNGEPGTTDTFTISVSGGPTEGGTLRSGNILIR